MQQFNKFRDTTGFIHAWAWTARFRDMIQEAATRTCTHPHLLTSQAVSNVLDEYSESYTYICPLK